MAAVKIRTGEVPAHSKGRDIPKTDWDALISSRRVQCSDRFQTDCSALLFYIEDGRENGFFGYPDEITYWREGLWLEPEAVPFAETYLRVRRERIGADDWRAVSFDEAVKLGGWGTNQHTGGGSNITSRGTTATYTLARLDRDRPELAARVRAGELSANAAAIEAGFRRRKPKMAEDFKRMQAENERYYNENLNLRRESKVLKARNERLEELRNKLGDWNGEGQGQARELYFTYEKDPETGV